MTSSLWIYFNQLARALFSVCNAVIQGLRCLIWIRAIFQNTQCTCIDPFISLKNAFSWTLTTIATGHPRDKVRTLPYHLHVLHTIYMYERGIFLPDEDIPTVSFFGYSKRGLLGALSNMELNIIVVASITKGPLICNPLV